MALLTETAPGGTESNYGWCGLCHCFTLFPHECPGARRSGLTAHDDPRRLPDHRGAEPHRLLSRLVDPLHMYVEMTTSRTPSRTPGM